MASFFDSMGGPSAAEPSSGMYRATVDFDAIESALAIPVALRRGCSVFCSTELSAKPVHSSTGGRTADVSPIPSHSATPGPPPKPLHTQGVAVRSHQPAVRSVAGVQLPSWAVVAGGSRHEQQRYEQSTRHEQARPGLDVGAVSRHVAHSKEPAPAKTLAAASEQKQLPANMLHQEYLQRQEQRRYVQSDQREQSQGQGQGQQMRMDSPQKEASHDMLMRRAAVQPQARRSRLGAAGALGYTDAGPVSTENPYTVDLIEMASQGRRQPLRASRRATRLGSHGTEQQQQSSGEGSGSFAHAFDAEVGDRRVSRKSERFGSAAQKYSMQTDAGAETPANYRRGGAPRMLPSLGELAMGLGGGGPLHGRRSVLGI